MKFHSTFSLLFLSFIDSAQAAGKTEVASSGGGSTIPKSNADSSKPDLKTSLDKYQTTLIKTFTKYRTEGEGKQPSRVCPNTFLDGFATGKEGPALHTCGKAKDGSGPKYIVLPNKAHFDETVSGKGKSGMSFIHFLVIPSEHIASSWEIKDPLMPSEMEACWKEFMGKGGSEKVLAAEEKKVKDSPDAYKHFKEMKALVKPGGLQAADFTTFFHVPPSIYHLHMHVVTTDSKFRKYSTTDHDDRCILVSNVNKLLQSIKAPDTDAKKKPDSAGVGIAPSSRPSSPIKGRDLFLDDIERLAILRRDSPLSYAGLTGRISNKRRNPVEEDEDWLNTLLIRSFVDDEESGYHARSLDAIQDRLDSLIWA